MIVFINFFLFLLLIFSEAENFNDNYILMNEFTQENVISAIEAMNEDQSALNFVENAKESNPMQLFLLLSQVILDDSTTSKMVWNCIVLISSILRPTIVRPLNVLKKDLHELDTATTDSIKQSLFRCLTFPEESIRLNSALCMSIIAQIEFSQRKWFDVFDQLKLLVDDTANFGEWAQIGSISAMREILSRATIRPRSAVFQSASNIVINSCLSVMSKEIDPELKIEVIKCLQIAIPIFLVIDQTDAQFYQQMLEIILAHVQIDNDQLHQQLFSLLSIFLVKIYKILNGELVGQIFTSFQSDLASDNEYRQLHIILLCKKIAKYELELFSVEDCKEQFCITELLEHNFDEIFLRIIANGDYSMLNESESLVSQYAALDTLILFGKVSPEILFQDCVTFYDTYKSHEIPSVQLSSFCAVQVVSFIQTDDAYSFIEANIESILEFCGCEEQLVRIAAFSVLRSSIENKPSILCKPENFDSVLQIIRFGLESDHQTAQVSLYAFRSLCEQSSYLNDGELLAINFGSIIEMLFNSQERPDAFDDEFFEEVYDRIFIFIQKLPKVKECQEQLIELFKKIFDHFAQLSSSTSSPSAIEERQKSGDLIIIIGIVQVLEDLILPFGNTLISTLIQELLGTETAANSFNCNDAHKIILTISQIIQYIGQEAAPFLDQLVTIAERGQLSNSPVEVNSSANLIGSIVGKMGSHLISLGDDGASIVQRLFQLVFNNFVKVETLQSTIPHLLFAMADIIKGVADQNPDYAQQFVPPIMEALSGFVKDLNYYVKMDFDAAISIADSLMNLFTIIIYAFPLETEFISENLEHVFIQVPIVVWDNKMLTKMTVEYFLSLMLCLIKISGRRENYILNNQKLREFLNFASSDESPYIDLKPTARHVRKFYSDI